ncbi:MAG: ATP diphosphatase [Halothiobacillaceae bacterium]|nr:MAG: ATP diphosphatase [Halothiobacillaceae bacterium]
MRSPIEQLLSIMVQLRDPHTGCPWDGQQTFATLVPYTLEEAYEVADAVERGDPEHLKDELGDLLLQVVFLARIAEEQQLFSFNDVATAITEKLIRRHPHVFAGAPIASPEELHRTWASIKAAERANKQSATEGHTNSVMDSVGLAMPAVTRATKLQKCAASVGFDWPTIQDSFAKVAEELNEVRAELDPLSTHERLEHEIGDLLLACTNLARHAKVESETALRKANQRFEARFRYMECQLSAAGGEWERLSAQQLDAMWCAAKRALG